MTERLFAARYHKAPHRISRVGMGTMGATNAMIRMSTWRQHPFDEEYAGGGEDTEWARQAIKKGEHIMFDPALNVRHSHGLAAIDSFKQWLHWRAVFNGPTHFKRSK
jgi:GT2 family glycosyltransferase